MARTVGDVALVLSAIAGPDPRSPIALETPGARFAEPLDRDFQGVRVAWSPDLGDLPVDPAVDAALAPQLAVLESIGCVVEQDEPDFSGADEAFKAWRAWSMGTQEPLLEAERERIKDTVIWNVEQGLSQSGRDLSRAEVGRSELYRRVVAFFERYDYLVCPVTQVPPFPVETRWIEEINGVAMETYIDWMKSCYLISATGLPAISVPAGFTEDGLPVGLQIVGRPRDEFSVLQLAHAFEQATQVWQRRPEMV
jgi:amidase